MKTEKQAYIITKNLEDHKNYNGEPVVKTQSLAENYFIVENENGNVWKVGEEEIKPLNTQHAIDISNESLEDAFATMPLYSNVYYATLKDWAKACLKHGANWQKEKDKAVIDKLTECLQGFVDCYEQGFKIPKKERFEAAKQLLTQLQK